MEARSLPNKPQRPAVKTPEELLAILKASAMGDLCFRHLLGYIRVGMTEVQVADEIYRVLMSLGAQGLAFDTICVTGSHSCEPHGVPSERKICEGDFVTLDFGAVVDGYCGDMTRTVVMGRASEEQRQIYQLVLNAQLAALATVRAGVPCARVDQAARQMIEEAGYGEYFIHGTGHGVGREVHEAPTLNRKSEEMLEAGMPVTVEPGIYLPDRFGVRIEDLAIVTEFGIINTVHSPKDLIVL